MNKTSDQKPQQEDAAYSNTSSELAPQPSPVAHQGLVQRKIANRAVQRKIDAMETPTAAADATKVATKPMDAEAMKMADGVAKGGEALSKTEGKDEDGGLKSAVLQSIYHSANKGAQKITEQQKQALQVLDVEGLSGPWKNLHWGVVQYNAAVRVVRPEQVDQGSLNVCGVAAVINALADLQPIAYASLVKNTFCTGQVYGKKANAQLLEGSSADSGTNECDWMVLSAVRDVNEGIGRYHGDVKSKMEPIEGMAFPSTVKHMMKELLGAGDVSSLTSYFWGEMKNANEVNSKFTGNERSTVVFMLVNAKYLSEDVPGGVNIPNHWVRLLTPFEFADDKVAFSIFTWGQVMKLNVPEKAFKKMLFEFIVGSGGGTGGGTGGK